MHVCSSVWLVRSVWCLCYHSEVMDGQHTATGNGSCCKDESNQATRTADTRTAANQKVVSEREGEIPLISLLQRVLHVISSTL